MTTLEAWTLGTSIAAIVISIGSLGASIYLGFLDRAKLQIESKYYGDSEYGPASISIHVANAGRRPLIIRMWAGEDDNGHWVGTFFGKASEGVRLDENEREDLILYKYDLLSQGPDEPVIFTKLWIEDSLGKRYPIPGSERQVKSLLES